MSRWGRGGAGRDRGDDLGDLGDLDDEELGDEAFAGEAPGGEDLDMLDADTGRPTAPGAEVAGDEEPAVVTEQALAADEVERLAARAPVPRRPGAFRRLYRGETSFDFVGRRRVWFLVSSIIILAGIVSLGVRGLDLGITFKGGTAWTVKAPGLTQPQALAAAAHAGLSQPTVEILGTGGNEQVRVTADLGTLSGAARRAETTRVIHALAQAAHSAPSAVSVTTVGPTWGGQVTQKALIALVVFLVLVAVYISLRFEPKMAVAAFVALLHDLLVTAGVYSLAGFQVTPDTVIAVLTILGYSLYDTVVVFDRVRDNTKGLGASGRLTYSDMVNLSMNQTLARSINTSLVAILPVLSVLLIGAELLGATTLQNYGLALFVGLLSGAYSSIFIASPVLAVLKEREPRYTGLRQRIEQRGERLALLTPAAAAALAGGGGGGSGAARSARTGTRQGPIRPGQSRRARPAPGAGAPIAPGAAANGAPKRNGSAAPAPAVPSAPAAVAANAPARPAGARRPAARAKRPGKGKRRR